MADPLSLTIGGWFAAATIQILLEKLTSHALKQWGSQSGHGNDLEKLRITLLKVKSLISHAERRPTKDGGLVELLRELKDIAYAAADLLDEYEYQHLQQIVEGSQHEPSPGQRLHQTAQASTSLPSIAKRTKRVAYRVCDCLSSKLSNIAIGCLTCKTHSLTSQSISLDEIKKIVERLELIYTGVRDIVGLVSDSSKQPETRKRRETASTLEEPKLYGRDKERKRLIEMLLESGDKSRFGGSNNVSVISIIGIGGVGKTTLAQYVYNDCRIEKHFQLRVWVCISDNFDEKRIIREIIMSISQERPDDLHNVTNLDYLRQILKEKLMGKFFLLVLDDVWTDKWKLLLPLLENGGKGSKVLVTCRDRRVVGMTVEAKRILLEGLASDDYSLLFEKHAFGDQDANEHGVLKLIGMEIAKKLRGSPLAAKTVGGMLNNNLNEEYWRKILKSGICISGQDSDDILPVLRFSYTQLPEHLQRCFAYCTVFPKDYKFDKDWLVQIWIAQDFVSRDREESLEDKGREYFDELLHGSFFQYVTVDLTSYYTMHDLMNDRQTTFLWVNVLKPKVIMI